MEKKIENNQVKQKKNQTTEVGFVKSVRNFLIYVDGLPSVRTNDLIVSDSGMTALVTSLNAREVEAWVLSDGQVKAGEIFHPSKSQLSVLVGPQLLGRAINPLGVIVDPTSPAGLRGVNENADIGKSQLMLLEREALGISAREFISEQFVCGIAAIDLLVPLGKGQRELVVGNMRSGKTGFILDLIVNQKDTDVVVVYGMIGKSMGGVKNTMQVLQEKGGLKNTVVVAGFSTDPLPLVYLTAKTAMAVAEYFQMQGKDVLLVLDDMGTHAKVYREISLLGNKFPGREAYPGDIFFQHASLLERAGKFDQKHGGGSITAIPVIELDLNDFSSYIPTNLMAMTDGHLLFKSGIYAQGRRPAVDAAMSVSRVGRQTQNSLQNSLATLIKQTMAAAEKLSSVTGFGGELPEETQLTLRQKNSVEILLSQRAVESMTVSEQVVLLSLPFSKFFADKEGEFISLKKETLIKGLRENAQLTDLIKNIGNFKNAKELIVKLDGMAAVFAKLTGEEISDEKLVDPQTWLPAA